MTPDLLGFVDREGNFSDTNPAWRRLLGYSTQEVQAHRFSHFLHPDDLPAAERAFERLQRGMHVLNLVNRYRCKDGSYHWISWNAVPEGDHIFCSGRCVSDEKANEAALRTREEEAKLREQFIAVLGHDVRNPLAAINAASRVIGRSSTDAQISEMVTSIQGSTGRIARLIDDVMDFASARLGGGLNLNEHADHDVKPILEHAVREIGLAHPETEIITEYDFCDPIYCDSGRISQLISNLLANAVTHGEPGAPVTVSAQDRDGSFYLWVTNLGAPIPPEVRKMLFEPFARGNVRQSQQGLGLGLFIAREIARAHGGDLTMRSDADGTVFTFNMPRD
ncbi:PAS domain-containing sensor histidine kinase [Roseovarius dicentrarchi]|uniref:PAS domain-containing sensor histidine kinase n=1 Tax=Roseovarius dicentrarchi TaxID=2250573 RepID=UPI001EF13270|nr:PAS domain-containing sensor histidine kinase [Roseovarius dicentrarchi]